MKKIFLIGNFASVMINFRKELIINLSTQNDVYCLAHDYDAKSKESICSFGATPIKYDLDARGVNPISDFFATIKLVKIIKQYKPDIVISFMIKPVIFGTIAAKLAHTKRIVGIIEGLGNAFIVHKRRNSGKNTNN